AVVIHFLETRASHHTANLHFFAKREQVGLHIEMLAAPAAAGRAEAGLDFVENQNDSILVTNLPQFPQPFAAEMIIAAFALDRFNNNGGNIDSAFIDEFSNLGLRFFLALDHVG